MRFSAAITTSLRALVVTVAASALGDERISVTPVVVDQAAANSEQSLRLWLDLEQALRADPRLRVVPSDGVDPDTGTEALARAESLRAEGRRDEAALAYADAVERFTRSDWRASFEAFTRALAWNAALQKNQADLSLLFTIRPDFQFPAGALSDDLAAEVELQRQGKAKATRATFVVESDTPAMLWIDGRVVGVTPATTPTLVAGRHRITAFAPGFQLLQRVELLTPGTPLQLAFPDSAAARELRQAYAEVSAGFKGEALASAGQRVRAASGTAEAVVVVLSREGVEVARLSATEVTRRRASDPGLASLRDVVRKLYDGPDNSQSVPVQPAVEVLPLVVLASGLAALTAGGVLLGFSRGQVATSQQIPQTDTVRYEQVLGSARASGYLSYGLLPLGAILAGLGTWLWLREPATAHPVSLWFHPDGVRASASF